MMKRTIAATPSQVTTPAPILAPIVCDGPVWLGSARRTGRGHRSRGAPQPTARPSRGDYPRPAVRAVGGVLGGRRSRGAPQPRARRSRGDYGGPAVRTVGGLLEVGHTRVLPDPHNPLLVGGGVLRHLDRKSTRLNSSHLGISYAVFCLK